MRLSFLLLVLLATSAIAEPPPQQLLGLWHSVSAKTRDGHDITPTHGGIEREFRRDGTILETLLSPEDAGDTPLLYQTHYTFVSPDKIVRPILRGGQKVIRQERFHIRGDIATFENLESGATIKMRRIPKSLFKRPKRVSEIPG